MHMTLPRIIRICLAFALAVACVPAAAYADGEKKSLLIASQMLQC